MKHLSLLIVLMIVTGTAVFSQRFEGGVLAGLNASQVDGDSYSGYHKPGVVTGVFALTDLSPLLYGGMEIKFAQKGSRKNPNMRLEDQTKYIMRLNYIDLPVYLGVRTSERTSILAGVSAGYLFSAKEFNNFGEFPEEDQRPFNEFDVQGFLGFRYQMTDRISVDLRGAYSLLPIREQPGEVLSYWLDSQFNNLLSTTVIYRLDF